MNKELIEQLRACAEAREQDLMTVTAALMRLAADALDAKAAPVGEWTPATTFPPFGEIVLTNHGPAYMTEKQPGVWFERLENLGIGRRLPATAVKQWRKIPEQAAPVSERLVVTVVDPDCRTTTEHVITERDVILLWNRIDTLERQQAREVVMPDVSAMAKVLSDRAADACNINRDDNWAMYGQEYIDDVQAMLAAAPSAPATVQGVNQQLLETLEAIVNVGGSFRLTHDLHVKARAAIAAARQEDGKV